MDKLTLSSLAAHQPRRAVKYGDKGVQEHAACALAYLSAPAVSAKLRAQSLAGLILATEPSRHCTKCFECGHADLEFE